MNSVLKNTYYFTMVFVLVFICVTSILIAPYTFNSNESIQKKSINSQITNPLSLLSGVELGNHVYHTPTAVQKEKIQSNFAHLQYFSGFTRNMGQKSNVVDYYYSLGNTSIGFGTSTIYFTQTLSTNNNKVESFSLIFVGANEVTPTGKGSLTATENYFIGKNAYTNIKSYQEIWYKNLYPQIDLKYFMTNQGLKYDFIVNPGGNPANIQIKVSSNVELKISQREVTFSMAQQQNQNILSDSNLKVYQNTISGTKTVASQFTNSLVQGQDNTYSFQLGNYNHNIPLIIDPLYLGFSTYLGGSQNDQGNGIVVDSAGNSYITGSTASSDFPIVSAYNSTYRSGSIEEVFVTKINATGNGLIFSTFIEGTTAEYGNAIAIDSAGNSYITGSTASSDYPTINAYNATYGGSDDAFVTKLNATGNGLVFSTYLGGNALDTGYGIAVDSSGDTYVAGVTASTDFPTKNAFNSTFSGGSEDAFITKFNSTGNGLIFSTYIGGNQTDKLNSLAIDNFGNSYITGYTTSPNYPTKNAYNSTYGGNTDAFVTKLNASGNGLVYSTFLGGSSIDYAYGIAVDNSNESVVTGYTSSLNFPLKNAYNSTFGGSSDVFVTKFNATGNGLIFSTYLGGTSDEYGNAITVDSAGNSYISGYTSSANFPTLQAYSSRLGGSYDAFVTELNTTGNGLISSTFLGGSGQDVANAIAIDSSGSIYVTGYTVSTNFPINHAFMSTYIGGGNNLGFVTKLSMDNTPPSVSLTTPINNSYLHSGTNIQLSITDSGSGVNIVQYKWDSGTNTTLSSPYTLPLISGDGPHVLTIYANDSAGNFQKSIFLFTTDDTAPTIILDSPVNASILHSGTAIQFTVTDALSGVDIVQYQWDSSTNTTLASPYTLPLISGDGSHILTIYANDTVGNIRVLKFEFKTDDTGPAINLLFPTNDSSLIPDQLINVTFTDPSNISSVLFDWDHGNNITLYDARINFQTHISPPSIIIPNSTGQHILQIYTNDSLNNQRLETFVFFTTTPNTIISTTTETTTVISTVLSTSNTLTIKSSPGFVLVMALVGLIVIVGIKRRKK